MNGTDSTRKQLEPDSGPVVSAEMIKLLDTISQTRGESRQKVLSTALSLYEAISDQEAQLKKRYGSSRMVRTRVVIESIPREEIDPVATVLQY